MNSPTQQEARVRQLIRAQQYREAAAACDELNQQYPDFASGWQTACYLAMSINEPRVAVSAIDRALELSPGKPEWLLQRIECLSSVGDLVAARSTAQQLQEHRFESAPVSASFALTLSRLGLYEAAKNHYLRAIELDAEEGQYYYNLATIQRFLGDFSAATEAVNRCIELRPDDEDAHLLRAGLATQTAESNHVAELQAAFTRLDGQPRRQHKLAYALAKELEDIEDYARSFEYLSKGAAQRRSTMRYTPQNDLDAMAEIQRVFDAEMFDGHIDGHANAEPIFVIGMPRTGTTLVERILASHSVVTSAGERDTFSRELVKHCRQQSAAQTGNPADLVALAAAVDFEALGEDYIAGTRADTGTTAHFIDKLPLNFLYAGLIHLALPKAKIVLLERNPMDTCYAVFKNLFEGIYPFSYDLEELANYFVAYRRLVDHWQAVMPGVMHVVRYEELVREPKPTIESLLSYCALSFEERCLEFHTSDAAATTASAAQVRQPIYRSSLNRWTKYREFLQPLERILQDAGIDTAMENQHR